MVYEEILKIGRKKYLSHGEIIVTICVWIVYGAFFNAPLIK